MTQLTLIGTAPAPLGDCGGCNVLVPIHTLRDWRHPMLVRRPYGYTCATRLDWCPGCWAGLLTTLDARLRRRATRGGREQLERVREAVQLPLWEAA